MTRGVVLLAAAVTVLTTSVIMWGEEPQASVEYVYENHTRPVEVPFLDITLNEWEQQHEYRRTNSYAADGDCQAADTAGGQGGQVSDLVGYELTETAEDSGRMETGQNETVSELVEPDVAADNTDTDGGLTYVGNWTISFYCPCEICCGVWATGCTASGVAATEWHTVATDMFDFGTELYVEGLGYFVVEDRGVSGEWLDVFVNDHQQALDLGMQTREVYIVG